jgi:hypothetical protein
LKEIKKARPFAGFLGIFFLAVGPVHPLDSWAMVLPLRSTFIMPVVGLGGLHFYAPFLLGGLVHYDLAAVCSFGSTCFVYLFASNLSGPWGFIALRPKLQTLTILLVNLNFGKFVLALGLWRLLVVDY